MAVYRDVPYAGMNFVVMIDGQEPAGRLGGVAEVILPQGRIPVDSYRNGNEVVNHATNVPNMVSYENLTLKRGLDGSLAWYEWWDKVRKGEPDIKKTVTIRLLSEDRATEAMEWVFQNAFPVNFYISALNAHDPEILIETLQLNFTDYILR